MTCLRHQGKEMGAEPAEIFSDPEIQGCSLPVQDPTQYFPLEKAQVCLYGSKVNGTLRTSYTI